MTQIKTQNMSEKEIKEGLKLFSLYIQKTNTTIRNADPIKENCYITSGDIIGVYFPNSEILTPEHKYFYDFCSISKVNNELGVIWSLKDEKHDPETMRPLGWLNEYIFCSFDEAIYGSQFVDAKHELLKRTRAKEKELNALKSIKRIYKKDGGQFAEFTKNYNVKFILEKSFSNVGYCWAKFCFNYDDYTIYLKSENVLTIEYMDQCIAENIAKVENKIKEYKNALKSLLKDFAKVQKATQQLKEVLKNNELKSYYIEQLKRQLY